MTMPSENQHELDWQAFCYISDELSDDDLAEFELRLASDQETREAVARAVQLAETLAVAELTAVRCAVKLKPARRWLSLAVSASTVAALLIAVSLFQLVWRASESGSVPFIAYSQVPFESNFISSPSTSMVPLVSSALAVMENNNVNVIPIIFSPFWSALKTSTNSNSQARQNLPCLLTLPVPNA